MAGGLLILLIIQRRGMRCEYDIMNFGKGVDDNYALSSEANIFRFLREGELIVKQTVHY